MLRKGSGYRWEVEYDCGFYRRSLFAVEGVLNNTAIQRRFFHDFLCVQGFQACSKKSVQQGRSLFCEWSVLSVRENKKMATCLREAASVSMEALTCQP